MEVNTNLLWGKYTWLLFHWMAEHIRNDLFTTEKEKIIGIIINICYNLPCITCRNHSKIYLKQNPIYRVNTKTDLIKYLYTFHNTVNRLSKKGDFLYSNLEKYKSLNFNTLIRHWFNYFRYGKYIKIDDFMAKQRLHKFKNDVVKYFNKNRHKFL